MYFIGLATDYDGTIAHDGIVDVATLAALERLKNSGRKLILVTGRELDDLARVFPRPEIFDRIVAENGALLHNPSTRETKLLGPAPPEAFVERLRNLRLDPLSVGHCIVATWEPNEGDVLDVIRDLGLELQIVFNKGAVMILPPGVNKASGMAAALDDLGISPQNIVAIGDAENDHAFLQASGCAVAVANALPSVKEKADLVTRGKRGAGVAELIDLLVEREAEVFAYVSKRHCVDIGAELDGDKVRLHPFQGSVLIAGSSGGGKSTLATAMLERFIASGFQICVVDPEGDHMAFQPSVVLGDPKTPPQLGQVAEILRHSGQNVVVNLLGVGIDDRPAAFTKLLGGLAELKARTGRPHWLLVDEAHHVLTASRDASTLALPQDPPSMILVTVDPAAVSADALRHVHTVFAFGDKAFEVIEALCKAVGVAAPERIDTVPQSGQALFWNLRASEPVQIIFVEKPAQERKRHTRKYAEGSLGEDKSFYFRGPAGALNLRAQNLNVFLQLADGVDDDTWTHHLRAHEYSQWFRLAIKDDGLADAAKAIEDDAGVDPRASRARMREAVESRYTAPV